MTQTPEEILDDFHRNTNGLPLSKRREYMGARSSTIVQLAQLLKHREKIEDKELFSIIFTTLEKYAHALLQRGYKAGAKQERERMYGWLSTEWKEIDNQTATYHRTAIEKYFGKERRERLVSLPAKMKFITNRGLND